MSLTYDQDPLGADLVADLRAKYLIRGGAFSAKKRIEFSQKIRERSSIIIGGKWLLLRQGRRKRLKPK